MGLELELRIMKDIDYTKKYHILSFYSMAALIAAVNTYMEHGYSPHGAPQFAVESETHYYIQAVTLNDKDILSRLDAIENAINELREQLNANKHTT